MRIDTVQTPKSSFLSVEKDLNIITSKICSNENLKKLLFYDSADALRKPCLTSEQTASLWGKFIKITPKVYVDREVLQYVIVSFDNYTQSRTNPEFRVSNLYFDIICHYDQWMLEDGQLRPYRIAAELDSMFDKRRLSGIGYTNFLSMVTVNMNNEFAGVTLAYSVVHGEEDKRSMANPEAQNAFEEMFNEREKEPLINGH